jgi:predicted metal-dependent hydrolase
MFDPSEIKVTRSTRRSIAIVILPNGTVEIRAPKLVPQFAINAFIKTKKDWIEKRLEMVRKQMPNKRTFIDGEKFLYLGDEYPLSTGTGAPIEIKDGKLLFPLALIPRGKEALQKWYIKQAKVVIREQVNYYSKIMGTTYNGISFSDTKTQWGRCTHDNRLQFNWRLIMSPAIVLRYVVIHELVHTTEKNHSAIFWNKVRKYNPSYKQQIKWLKENGNGLMLE